MNGVSLGHQLTRVKVVAWPTREYNDLKDVCLLGKQRAKPLQPAAVALNELVVQHNRRLQVFRERQPVQS
jgi:hypothetical protein